ncbi:hypothetical protein BCR34DRAFT_120390 [Clohesyomyces aquaticus]|uniref:Uncharacterized protein n=1 Tax=Clohesyomyces aquaticus TaxID=1231657 RepID=A0A1Y2A1E9_9PLEO|nr:hypothetical protein BCR34DRAFT_120390 [Clohesyomyces aquaticus]
MDSAERVTRLDSYSKRWNPIFETDRHIKVDGSFVDNKRKLNSRSDEISIHFRDDEDEGLYTPVPKELIAFCKSANISDLGSQTTTPRRGGWLDDREYGTGRFRRYQNPLAANHLLRHLQKPRFKKTTTASTDSIVGANSSCIKTSCTPDMNFTDQLGEEGRSSADDGGSVAMGLDQNECTQSYMGEAKSFQRVQTGDTERTLHAGIGFEAEEFSEVQPNCTNSDGLLHTDANDSADGDRRLM